MSAKTKSVADRYLIKLYWSDDDEAFVAEVPALPGCAAHGDSKVKALVNINQAMKLWIASAEKHKDPIPASDRVMQEIARLSPILNMSKLARRAGMSKFTLASKLQRGERFTESQAKKLIGAMGSI